MEEMLLNEVKSFMDADGKVKQYPSKAAKSKIILQYLAEKFESGKVYKEMEVNAVLKSWHTFSDHCLLRRELIDNGFLSRTADGKEYTKVN